LLADFLACVAQSCHLHFARAISQIHALLPKLYLLPHCRASHTHSLTVLSQLPEAMVLPSGEKAIGDSMMVTVGRPGSPIHQIE
jgi:hypothetical protein